MQLFLYLFDFTPFYIVSFLGASAFFRLLGNTVHSGRMTAAALTACVGAIALHSPFFAFSVKTIVYALMYGVLFAGIMTLWAVALPRFAPVALLGPHRTLAGLVVAVGVFVVSMWGGFNVGWIENRTFFDPDKFAIGPKTQAGVAFSVEKLPFVLHNWKFSVVDFDDDGWFDIFGFDPHAGRFVLHRNREGRFVEQEGFWNTVDRADEFLVADIDGDGRKDLLVNILRQPAPSRFHDILKKSFWYLYDNRAISSRLYLQKGPDTWEEATQQRFPQLNAHGYRKVEPNMAIDLNADGRTDLIWSQYPNGREQINRLFVQQPDGRFIDRMAEMIDWSEARVFPEGADFADIDGDGDIDLFAYGFLFLNDDGRFRQQCGEALEGFPCDSVVRNEEGVLFEDFDNDGVMDMLVSYFGADWAVPRYRMQLYRGSQTKPGRFERDAAFGHAFYGAHYYLRAKDIDHDGQLEILTMFPGRLVSFTKDGAADILPDITKSLAGAELEVVGWIDVEEDGDWDIIVTAVPKDGADRQAYLLRNQLDPKDYIKISARGERMRHNQDGTTLTIDFPQGHRLIRSIRSRAGFQGDTDPRVVISAKQIGDYDIKACFPSLLSPPKPGSKVEKNGAVLVVRSVSGHCVSYRLTKGAVGGRLDLTLVAGPEAGILD